MASAPTRERREGGPRRFLPPDARRRGAVPADAADRAADRDPRRGRDRRLRRPLLPALGAAGALRARSTCDAAQNNQLRTRRVAAPRGAILDRNGDALVANVDRVGRRRSGRPTCRRRAATTSCAALSKIVHVPVARMVREIAERRGDLARPGGRQAERPRGPGRLPVRAPGRVPGRRHREHVRPPLPVPGARRAGARLRRRDLAAAAEAAAAEGLPRRRRGRPGGRRVRVRHATCAARRGSRSCGSTPSGRPTSDPKLDRQAAAGRRAPADDRREPPAGGRAGLRNGIAIAHADGKWAARRRRDRRARPPRRLGARDGVVPDVQAEPLRRPRLDRRSSRRPA